MRSPISFSGHRGAVYTLCEGPNPFDLLSGSGDGTVVGWSLEKPDQGTLLVEVGSPVYALLSLAERYLLFIGTETGRIHVVDLRTRKEVRQFDLHRKGVFAFTRLPEGRIAAAAGDGTMSVWDLDAPKGPVLTRQIPLSAEKLRGMALSPGGELLAVADGAGPVHVLGAQDLNERFTLAGHAEGALSAVWHPSKPVLLTGGKDGYLRNWHTAEDFRPLHAFAAHKAGIYAIAFNAPGVFATASRDKTAKIWDSATMDVRARLDRSAGGHSHSVNAALWAGDALITAGDDKRILVWRNADARSPAS
ncbi:MAG: hypothetical protein IPK99_11425 [Flavobacteriales bacterium]|nr:hypothetical protein [Flavobacteriales bacterium]